MNHILAKLMHENNVSIGFSINNVQCRKIQPRHLRYFGTFWFTPCPTLLKKVSSLFGGEYGEMIYYYRTEEVCTDLRSPDISEMAGPDFINF